MRVDKFLKNARLIKRRTVAKEACEGGRISVNGRKAKAGTNVCFGDIVRIQFGNSDVTVKVVALPESPKKEEAESMYEIVE